MLSTYLANKLLDHFLKNTAYAAPATVYLSLHTADPGLTGANEVAGGGYVRKAVTFGAAATKSSANSADVNFTNMPAANEVYAGLWDAESNGNFLLGGALTVAKSTLAGDTFQIVTGDLTIGLT